jgi:hypothetical protein
MKTDCMLIGAVDHTTTLMTGDAVFSGDPMSMQGTPSEGRLMLPLGAIQFIVGTSSVKSPIMREVPCMPCLHHVRHARGCGRR